MTASSRDTQTSDLVPFHLAFPVTDLASTRAFYVDLLGCRVGRESERWIDFDFFGHQITAHAVQEHPAPGAESKPARNQVDDRQVPVPHFGAILEWPAWQDLADRLKQASVQFVIEPYVRFAGQVGEQATMFLQDPSGNYLEFKAFKDRQSLFQS